MCLNCKHTTFSLFFTRQKMYMPAGKWPNELTLNCRLHGLLKDILLERISAKSYNNHFRSCKIRTLTQSGGTPPQQSIVSGISITAQKVMWELKNVTLIFNKTFRCLPHLQYNVFTQFQSCRPKRAWVIATQSPVKK